MYHKRQRLNPYSPLFLKRHGCNIYPDIKDIKSIIFCLNITINNCDEHWSTSVLFLQLSIGYYHCMVVSRKTRPNMICRYLSIKEIQIIEICDTSYNQNIHVHSFINRVNPFVKHSIVYDILHTLDIVQYYKGRCIMFLLLFSGVSLNWFLMCRHDESVTMVYDQHRIYHATIKLRADYIKLILCYSHETKRRIDYWIIDFRSCVSLSISFVGTFAVSIYQELCT